MKMKFNSSSLIFLCLSTLLFSCTKDRTEQCDIDPSYSFDIAPFFNTYCVSCHQSNSSSGGVNLDNFEEIKEPKSARAVGRVSGSNKIPIIIPCHRIVGSNGELVGYSGGGGLLFKSYLQLLEKS